LHRLKEWYNTHKTLAGFSFWKLLKESNMTLISNEETSDRKVHNVTKEIALKVKDDCKIRGDMAIHFLFL
jgi:hypothetical protein